MTLSWYDTCVNVVMINVSDATHRSIWTRSLQWLIKHSQRIQSAGRVR